VRPLQACIDLAAFRHNLQVVKRYAPTARVMAVIKANAYGHGLMRAASALRDADGFAVVELDAAVRLREAGYGQRILLLEGFFSADELEVMSEFRLTPVIHALEQIDMLAAATMPSPLEVFVKVNTGMNRLGLSPLAFSKAYARLVAMRSVGGITLMMHFARADEPGGIDAQLRSFDALTAKLALPRSLANSAALIVDPCTHGDWVRPGIMLYGSSPFVDRKAEGLGLRPVMQLLSQVIAVQELEPGDIVGYGATFRAEHAMRIAVVACGYADGYPRHALSGTPIAVDGVRTATVGRVSMDMLCADITYLPHAGVGSGVTLWGDTVSVDEVADAAGTVGYELLCAITQRVPMMEV
jgi:alanine racemase